MHATSILFKRETEPSSRASWPAQKDSREWEDTPAFGVFAFFNDFEFQDFHESYFCVFMEIALCSGGSISISISILLVGQPGQPIGSQQSTLVAAAAAGGAGERCWLGTYYLYHLIHMLSYKLI